jgi:hypothetical protein
MKKIFIILLLILSYWYGFSQTIDTINYNELVKKEVLDSSSIYYYPKLLNKIVQNPSVIKVTEVYYLYYGEIYQPGYRNLDYMNDEYASFIRAVMSKNCKKASKLGFEIISKYPVQLTTLLHLNICLKDQDYPDSLNYVELRYRLLLDAILSTGDGKSMESAIRVTNIDDESVIKGVLGFLGGKTYLTVNNHHAYDVWEVGDKKLYFELVMK